MITGRFRVERVLGQGGMGEVLAVLEPTSGSRFALKRLLPGAKPRHTVLLQREFHTLASLRHPHVVRAFDFGTDDGVPYYTMELLAGADVEALAPLPYTQVVPLLRDVASALSVIHARRLVHRDVGARNVWRTPEGTIKLIDFGALTSFGASSDITGTPPYVAPEALRTHQLDQRTDLFSLGALAYYLLTGRHAYAARSLSELEQRWSLGHQPVGSCVAELGRDDLPALPEALEQLIEALLAAAPDARPATCAEVLDALDGVLPGTSAVSQQALDGVLASKAFVGREAELKRLHAARARLEQRGGAGIALLGARGVGRSRLLAEFATEARLAGQHVVQVAGTAGRTALAAAAHSVLRLLEVLPDAARAAAAPRAALLGHVSEEVRAALDLEPEQLEQIPALAGEARLRIQGALQSFWECVTRDHAVVLLLDDLHAVDEASLALFSTLAREAKQSKLLVVASLVGRPEEVQRGPARAFLAASQVLLLQPLPVEDCEHMLRSIFGEVEHLARTARHLAEAAEGNPGQLLALCEYLVRGGSIRCNDGAWVLPQELSGLAIPASFDQLEQVRQASLSVEARKLAGTLSVVQGDLPLELCSTLSGLPAAELFAAIEALCAAQVLKSCDTGYAFHSEPLRLRLCAALDPEEATAAHRRAGEALLTLEPSSQVQRVEAGVHLMKGGDTRRGAQVVHGVAVDWTGNVSEDSFHIGYALEAAYTHMRELALSNAERLAILSSLASAGFFTHRRLGFTYGEEALRCGERVCRMDLARRLSPWLGKKLSLIVALIVAGVALRRAAKRSTLVPELASAIRLFMTAAGSLAGMYTLCLAREKVLESARAIEPLAGLGDDHVAAIVHQFALGCATTVSDRNGEARQRWTRLMERLNDPRPIKLLDRTSRDYYTAASMYAWGGAECWSDRSRSEQVAEWLEQQPLKLYQLTADQVRAQYFAQQGRMREVASCRARVETRATQRGMTWQAELWWPCTSVALATRQRDALALKRAAGQLRHLGQDTPSLRDFIDYAQASYLLLRGRPGEAVPLLEALLSRRSPEDIGNANLVGLLASGYNCTGRFADAQRVAGEAIAQLREEDLDAPGLTLRVRIEWCLALAGRGEHQRAAEELDAMIAHFLPDEGPLTLGALHDARAQVARRAEDETTAALHVEQMERWYRKTECSSLIQYCDHVARRWSKRRAANDPGAAVPGVTFLAQISARLTSSTQDPPEEMLAQVVRGTMAEEGALMYTSPAGEWRVLKSRTGELPPGLTTWIEERISVLSSYRTETQNSEEGLDPNVLRIDQETWRLQVLYTERDASEHVVGGIALRDPAVEVPLAVQRAIASQLEGAALRFTVTGGA